ncbi:MAG: hypothetical protein R3C56_02425 [Pirellulaceae bacterium]
MAALRQLEADRPNLWDDVLAVAGLSLGEYTAVTAAGGIDFEAGLGGPTARLSHAASVDAAPSGMCSVLKPAAKRLGPSVRRRPAAPIWCAWPTCSAPAISPSPNTWVLEVAERL